MALPRAGASGRQAVERAGFFVVDCLVSAVYEGAEAQVRVQRVVSPDDDAESWTVLADDWAPLEPVELFLAHLTDQGRSPNTVKAYAHDLKDYFAYLEGRGADWRLLRFDELAGAGAAARTTRRSSAAAGPALPTHYFDEYRIR